MSKETKADRIVRERRLQKEAQEKRQQIEEAHYAEDKRRGDIRKITQEIPRVLQLLADLGYPGMEDLNVCVKPTFPVSLFKLDLWRIKAGWYLGEYERPFYDGLQTTKLYLVSDGSICFSGQYAPYGGPARLPKELDYPGWDDIRSCVLGGLNRLRRELEAKLKK